MGIIISEKFETNLRISIKVLVLNLYDKNVKLFLYLDFP